MMDFRQNDITLTNSAGQVKVIAGTAQAGFKVGDKILMQGNTLAHADGNAHGGHGESNEMQV